MGNDQACDFGEKFQKKYQFVQYLPKSAFGPIKIYRKKEPFYEYVMVVRRTIHQTEVQLYLQQLSRIRDSFRKENPPDFLRVYGFEIQKQSGKCSEQAVLKVYIEYLNFTLKDLITHHCQKRYKFSLNEVNYVARTVLYTQKFLEDFVSVRLRARPDCIFVSPEGEVKFTPIQLAERLPLDQNQCFSLNCKEMVLSKKLNFSDKLLLYETKKLFSQMLFLHTVQSYQNKEVFQYARAVNQLNKFKQIQKILPLEQAISKLSFEPNNKQMASVLGQHHSKQCQGSRSIETGSECSENSGKISVKNSIEKLRSERAVTTTSSSSCARKKN